LFLFIFNRKAFVIRDSLSKSSREGPGLYSSKEFNMENKESGLPDVILNKHNVILQNPITELE